MKRNSIIAVILLVAFVIIIGFSIGYRVDGFKIVKAGRLEIVVPYANSTITIDGKHSGYAHEDGEIIVYRNLTKGNHTVIVSNEDRYPWIKDVEVPYHSHTVLYPFNIKISSNSSIIEKTDDSYKAISTGIKNSKTPTIESPVFSDDGKVAVFIENEIIKAQWQDTAESAPESFCDNTKCEKTISIIPIVQTINSIEFYPGRNDVIIIATKGGVYALEVARDGKPNFQPILISENPFIHSDGNSLYALDGETLGKVTLD